MFDEDDIDDIDIAKIERKRAAKRHQDLLDAFRALTSVLNKEKKDDDKVVAAIERLSNKLNELKPQPFPEIPTPEIKVESHQHEVVKSIEQLSLDLLSELRKYNDKPIVDKYEFDFKRGGWQNTGEINKATVQVIYKK